MGVRNGVIVDPHGNPVDAAVICAAYNSAAAELFEAGRAAVHKLADRAQVGVLVNWYDGRGVLLGGQQLRSGESEGTSIGIPHAARRVAVLHISEKTKT